MAQFYEKYLMLCAKANKTPSGAANEMGLSRGTANGWKNGKQPNDVTVAKIAQYFNVPVSFLKNDSEEIYPQRHPLRCAEGFSEARGGCEMNAEVEARIAEIEKETGREMSCADVLWLLKREFSAKKMGGESADNRTEDGADDTAYMFLPFRLVIRKALKPFFFCLLGLECCQLLLALILLLH